MSEQVIKAFIDLQPGIITNTECSSRIASILENECYQQTGKKYIGELIVNFNMDTQQMEFYITPK